MAKISYEKKKLDASTLAAIAQANEILDEYAADGYTLTLRQLYYQHVARGLLANTERNYKRLGRIVNDGRMCGYIDWDSIIDRTRNVQSITHWDDPAEIIEATAASFRRDLWADQDHYVECWIEKDALVGMIIDVCNGLDMPYFSCRGYTSQSEMWGASRRLLERLKEGKHVTILHLGDHDPSGIDMSRDIEHRLWTFCAIDYLRWKIGEGEVDANDEDEKRETIKWVDDHLHVDRLALTMEQVRQYNPPPNPAKITDSRATGYIANYGNQSWELDALDPPAMTQLIRDAANDLIDIPRWNATRAIQHEGQELLRAASEKWQDIIAMLRSQP